MSLSGHTANVALVTVTDPDDQTIVAAPTGVQRLYVYSLTVIITTAVASTVINIEDGVGGDVIASVNGAAIGTTQFKFPRGYALSETTLLNVTNAGATGAAGRVIAQYTVGFGGKD